MEYFLKTYGIFIGFTLGIFSIYIKHFIDKKAEVKKSKEKLKKLCFLISDSPPPEWIKTYSEPEIRIIYGAFHQNTSNLSKFRSRLQAINAYINEISSDIYSHLETIDIVKFNEIKFRSENVLRKINDENEKLESLDFSANKKLSSFRSPNKLSERELEKAEEVIRKATENQRRFESYIRETGLLFLMIKFDYQYMMEACKIKSISRLEYCYEYEKDKDKNTS